MNELEKFAHKVMVSLEKRLPNEVREYNRVFEGYRKVLNDFHNKFGTLDQNLKNAIFTQLIKDYERTSSKTLSNIANALVLSFLMPYLKKLGRSSNKVISHEGGEYSGNVENYRQNFDDFILKHILFAQELTLLIISTLLKGLSIYVIIKLIRKKINNYKYQALRLARSFTTITLYDSWTGYAKRNGVKKVIWLNTLESNVCHICRRLAGVYSIDNVPSIPHPNCRCIVIPYETYQK